MGVLHPGARGYIGKNVQPGLSVCNGSPITFRSLTLGGEGDSSSATADDAERLRRAAPGDVVEITMPFSVNVELEGVTANALIGHSLNPDVAVVPIVAKFESTPKIFFPGKGRFPATLISHAVDPSVSATFFKAQGRTMERVLACLNVPAWGSITFEAFFVFISRVKFGTHAKILPLHAGGTWAHLADLHPKDELVIYLAGFRAGDENALFDVGLANTAVAAIAAASSGGKAPAAEKRARVPTRATGEAPKNSASTGKKVRQPADKAARAAPSDPAPATAARVPSAADAYASFGVPQQRAASLPAAFARDMAAAASGFAARAANDLIASAAVQANRLNFAALEASADAFASATATPARRAAASRAATDAARTAADAAAALAAAPAPPVPISHHVSDVGLGSLSAYLDSAVMTLWFSLLEEWAPGGAVTCLSDNHTTLMPGGVNRGDGAMCTAAGARLGTRHLDGPVACPVHVPGHYMLLYADHTARTIRIFDPARRRAYVSGAKAAGQSFNDWLRDERARLGRPPAQDYTVILSYNQNRASQSPLPLQSDGNSCGAFVCAYAYFMVLYGRPPCNADFTSAHAAVLRQVIYDACMTGGIRRPLAPVPALPLVPVEASAGGAAGGGAPAVDDAAIVDAGLSQSAPPRATKKAAANPSPQANLKASGAAKSLAGTVAVVVRKTAAATGTTGSVMPAAEPALLPLPQVPPSSPPSATSVFGSFGVPGSRAATLLVACDTGTTAAASSGEAAAQAILANYTRLSSAANRARAEQLRFETEAASAVTSDTREAVTEVAEEAARDALAASAAFAAATAPPPPVSRHVGDAGLASLRGYLDTEVITYWFQLLESAANGAVACLTADHTTFMPGGVSAGDGSSCTALDASLGTRHLDRPIACSMHVPGHHLFLYADHVSSTIRIFDPAGSIAYVAQAEAVGRSFNAWLRNERMRLRRPATPDYGVVLSFNNKTQSSGTLTLQSDGSSCGAFVCAYAYFMVFRRRLPSKADFASTQAHVLRAVIYDACVTGRIRLPLSLVPGPVPVVGCCGGACGRCRRRQTSGGCRRGSGSRTSACRRHRAARSADATERQHQRY